MVAVPSYSSRPNLKVLSRPKERRAYQPFGAARQAWRSARRECLLVGPANTGKSRALLEKLHYCADKYPGIRGLMVRKTRKSLTQSAMVTYEQKVLPEGWLDSLIHFNTTDQQYEYPNGSIIAVAGMDDPDKIQSSEWDMIYVQEATELNEEDWEIMTKCLRNKVMRYQQLIADCNPSYPTHWLKKRCDRGATLMLYSRHEDNPTFTPEDQATLDALTGVRKKRLRDGIWAAAEGIVYEEWDPAIHLVDRSDIPFRWPRYWVLDFGFRHPFCLQWWAEQPDGELVRYREIYMTQRLVEEHAKLAMKLSAGEPRPVAIICDSADAEGRATFQKHTGYDTVPAQKAISMGIQDVQSRLRVQRNKKPGVRFMRDSLVERDPWLESKKMPMCTEEEFESYVWNEDNGRKKGEEPVDKDNHGMDCLRYLCRYKEGGQDIDELDEETASAISGCMGY